jgi:choline monooxygenase
MGTLRDLIAGFDPSLPLPRAQTPPAAWYTDPAVHALEIRSVFARSWQPVALAQQVAEPGQAIGGVFAETIPWLIVRDLEGTLRAFHNVCRHKAAILLQGHARCTELVCPYHGWRYGLDGGLKTARLLGGIQNFDRTAMSLPPMAVEIWGPFVCVNPNPLAVSLAEQAPEITQQLGATRWDQLTWLGRRSYPIRCNWKVFVDNYLDGGYHIPNMHPSLDAQLDMAGYRTTCFGRSSLQTSAPTAHGDHGLDYDVDQRLGDGTLYAWLYPNFMVNRYGPVLDTNWIVPRGPDAIDVIFDFFFQETEGPQAEAFIERSMAQTHLTQVEDVAVSESVQIGLNSVSFDTGRYAPGAEVGIHHFHRLLAEDLRRDVGLGGCAALLPSSGLLT